MARNLTRSCPRCNGYLGIVLREPGRNVPLQAVNGHCLGCGLSHVVDSDSRPTAIPPEWATPEQKQSGVKGFGEIVGVNAIYVP